MTTNPTTITTDPTPNTGLLSAISGLLGRSYRKVKDFILGLNDRAATTALSTIHNRCSEEQLDYLASKAGDGDYSWINTTIRFCWMKLSASAINARNWCSSKLNALIPEDTLVLDDSAPDNS